MSRWTATLAAVALMITAGCSVNFTKRSPWDIQRLEELSAQLEQFQNLARLKASEADQLRAAQRSLQQSLPESQVGFDERGVVTRMLDQVLFDSGKAELKPKALQPLQRLGAVLNQYPDQPIGVEGHTDNVPIKHSGWASNQALSLARANAVANYLSQNLGIDPDRLIVIGYGEDRPIASNETAEGKSKNRRVEIILLPKSSKSSYQAEADRQAQSKSRYSK